MKKIFLLCFLCFSYLALANSNDYTFEFSLEDFQIQTINNGCVITPLNESYRLLEDVTEPGLPYFYTDILIPSGNSVQDIDCSVVSQQIVFDSIYLYAPLAPVITDSIIQNSHPQYIQQKYKKLSYPKQTVQIVNTYKYASYQCITLQLCPFVYESTGKLTFISKLVVSINQENTNSTQAAPASIRIPSRINTEMLTMCIKNKEVLNSLIQQPKPFSQNIDYLIITSQALSASFLPLQRWKTAKGVRAKIITLEDIIANYEGVSTQLKIKNCIKDYVDNKGTQWVLLGGDNTIVPVMGCYAIVNGKTTDNTIPCDLFYACFDGAFDWNANGNNLIGEIDDNVVLIPSVYLSRLPIRTAEHVQNYTQKLLAYEQTPALNNYANKMLLCGKKLWNYMPNNLSDAQMKSEKMYSEFIAPFWNGTKRQFYDTYTDFGGAGYELNPTNINSQLNNGYHFLHYASHGGEVSYATEQNSYTTTSALQLTNKSTPLIIVTMACLTNRFDSNSDPCLSEAFIRNPIGGAVCYLGSSRYGWGWIDSLTVSLGTSFSYNAVFFKKLFSGESYNFAKIVALTKLHWKNKATFNGSYRWIQYSLNAIGDPEMPIYTADPLLFNNISISKEGNTLTINTNGILGCRITVTSSNDYGASYYKTTLNNNKSVASFTNVPSHYTIVITKHNYVPYIYSDQLYIQNESFDNNRTYNAGKVFVGKEVTDNKPEGEVIIQDGGHVVINASDTITLDTGVEVELGGYLEVNNN